LSTPELGGDLSRSELAEVRRPDRRGPKQREELAELAELKRDSRQEVI
jgi:hypothetical protein